MIEFFYFIADALLFIWMLPQNLLGLLVIFFSKAKWWDTFGTHCAVYTTDKKNFGAVSLGRFIIMEQRIYDEPSIYYNCVRHENGHFLQGKIFGPLYLIAVGLPSIINNILARIFGGKFITDYYKKWPENNADTLGCVIR